MLARRQGPDPAVGSRGGKGVARPEHGPRRDSESRATGATRSRLPSSPAKATTETRRTHLALATAARVARPYWLTARGAFCDEAVNGRPGRRGGTGSLRAPPLPLLRPDLPAAGPRAEPTLTGPRDSARRAPSRDIMVAYWRQAGLR